MKKVACYVRVSTLDKQKKGKESQRKVLQDYCENQGFNEVLWYEDEISGFTTNRPAFAKLQQDIFRGRVHTVVCWKLDRLSRSLRDGVNLLTDWLEKNIRIISISQQLDFSGSIGKIIASFLFGLAEMERANLSENVKRGMALAKSKGVRLGKRAKLFGRDIVPLLQAGSSIADIATKLNKSRQAVYDTLKRENIDLQGLLDKA
jgi:DNA invertase Pin-like site-specific DNA recombinase